ncbi:hypothetical protein LOD99_3648 [Oopsacas minuta]|uniref:Uncharacterized protein n=1 Tax=Oopsacas minuta TaxID=111878 RepID=A0AAV7JWZ9_9METZ|nr:hypothetical protein LOD99_3648 [Oopsacas minuta]
MSGEVPRLEFNFSQTDYDREESISPYDLKTVSANNEKWLVDEASASPSPDFTIAETIEVVATENPENLISEKSLLTDRLSILAPEPLLPTKYHPLCFCYRHPDDYDHHQPRVYTNGIPNDEDVVIYSEVEGDVTWAELKAARPDTPNLHKLFPLLQWWQHNEEEEAYQKGLLEKEKKISKVIEDIRKATANEKLRLDRLFPLPNVTPKQICTPKPKSPSLKRNEHINKVNTPYKTADAQRNRPTLKQTKQNTSTLERRGQKDKVKALNKVVSLSDHSLREKKAKTFMPFCTPEEHIFYEIYGCTKKEMQERRDQEKRMKAGVRF